MGAARSTAPVLSSYLEARCCTSASFVYQQAAISLSPLLFACNLHRCHRAHGATDVHLSANVRRCEQRYARFAALESG